MSASTVRLRIFRWKPGDSAPHTDEVMLPVDPRDTVLDALLAIRREDPSLSFRHSCLHASCGTCGLRVNGREALACVTRLKPLGETVTVEPLDAAPLLGDLVVGMGDFYERAAPAGLPLVRASERPSPEPATRLESCIECGLCVSACPVSGSDPAYLGPAALAAAWRVVEEPRGRDPADVLAWVDSEQGCWRCHVAFECSAACPAGAAPAESIMRLRGKLVRDHARTLRKGVRAPPRPPRHQHRRRAGMSADTTDTSTSAPKTLNRRRGVAAWVSVRDRRAGGLAFIANRVTALSLVGYLYVHLGILSLLAVGEGAYDTFVDVATHPLLLALDVVLVAGLVGHGLYGVRSVLVGTGLVNGRSQRALWGGPGGRGRRGGAGRRGPAVHLSAPARLADRTGGWA